MGEALMTDWKYLVVGTWCTFVHLPKPDTKLSQLLFLSPGQTYCPTQANSSQVAKPKLALMGGQTTLPSWASLQETIQLSEYNCGVTCQQISKRTWQELAEMAKWWNIWRELGENLSLIKFKPTRSNSSQLKPSGWPNDTNSIKVVNLARVGLSWRTIWPARALMLRQMLCKILLRLPP